MATGRTNYTPTPYRGSINGLEERRRNTIFGLDERLVIITDNRKTTKVSPEDEDLLRRTSYRYSMALLSIKEELEKRPPRVENIASFARDALSELPVSEPRKEGEHISIRMCQWMIRDRFIDLARILDTEANGGDILAEARKRVRRAFAPMTLR